MPDLKLLLEADRRGILPPDKKSLLDEAKRRGLVGGGASPQPMQAGGLADVERQVHSGVKEGASVLGQAVSNLPGSAWQLAKDMSRLSIPPSRRRRELGILQCRRGPEAHPWRAEVRSTRMPSGSTSQTDMGVWMRSRRPSRKILRALLLISAACLLGRSGLAVKAAGTAGKAGKVAKAVGSVGQATRSAVGKGAKAVGSGVAEVLGVTTGASSQPIKMAYQAGKGKGRERKLIEDSMKGKTPQAAVVGQAKEALKTLKTQKNERFIKMRQEVFGEGTGVEALDFNPIAKNVKDATKIGQFKDIPIRGDVAKTERKLKKLLTRWDKAVRDKDGAIDADKLAEYHTVEGMDAMRQSIGDIRMNTQPGTQARRMADKAYASVRGSVSDQVPGYDKMLKAYADDLSEIKDIERSLSLGEKAATETALRKLQAIMRNDVTSAYGQRSNYATRSRGCGRYGFAPRSGGAVACAMGSQRALTAWEHAGGRWSGSPESQPFCSGTAHLSASYGPSAIRAGAMRGGISKAAANPRLAAALAKFPKTGKKQILFQAGRSKRVSEGE